MPATILANPDTKWLRQCSFLFYTSISSLHNLIQALIVICRNPLPPPPPPFQLTMLILTGILRTLHKHSSVTTLRGGGRKDKEFDINVANCPIIFGQDCRHQGYFTFLLAHGSFWPSSALSWFTLRMRSCTVLIGRFCSTLSWQGALMQIGRFVSTSRCGLQQLPDVKMKSG